MSASIDEARANLKRGTKSRSRSRSALHSQSQLQPDAHTLLALWESCVGVSAFERDDALLRGTSSDAAPLALGERNAKLLDLHRALFGRRLDLISRCPGCGTAAEFAGDCAALASACRACGAPGMHHLEAHGYSVEFRLPDAADVIAAATASASNSDPADDFARRLLARCVLACRAGERDVPVDELPQPVLDALSAEMETLDPGAAVSFAVECPNCRSHWDAPLDVGELVWRKLRAAAERLLLEVDALARAYGWTEAEVLRLSPTRRAAYLQLAG